MSISTRRPGNEWLRQFEKYLLGLIRLNKYSEKSICSIAFLNEGIKPETTSKYIRHLTDYGVIEEKGDGVLNILIDMKDLETKNVERDEKMMPYKKGKSKVDKIDENETQKQIDKEGYMMYVQDCIKNKEMPTSYDIWVTNLYDSRLIEEEGKGKNTIPIKVNSKKKEVKE